MNWLLRTTTSVRLLLSILFAGVTLLVLSQISDGRDGNVVQAGHLAEFDDGLTTECETLNGEIDSLLIAIAGPLGLIASELIPAIPEPGWVWADPAAAADNASRFRSASGKVVTDNQVARTDFPTIHDSHDFFFNIAVEPGQEGTLSRANNPNGEGATFATEGDLAAPTELHIEWEIGTFPSETDTDPERTFPKWVWPNFGDRVYTNGDWIYDCGHPTEISDTGQKLFRSEIHPARLVASMRQQMRTMPGSGTTPVPVTATDLYIHGHAGLAVDDLVCGPDIIVDAGTCSPVPYPRRGTPIDDDYQFEICLPTSPFDKAVPAVLVEDGPDNSITDPALAPNLDRDGDDIVFEEPVAGTPCDDPATEGTLRDRMIEVEIPLDGSGVTPEDKYTRRIYAGWIFPAEDLRHLKLTLNKMDLHDDMDIDPGDCECTFFFMSVDRAPDEWIRLSTFATGNMNDYDDDDGLGDGEMGFSGADFDFYVGNGLPFTVQAKGYDQDCLDNRMSEIPIATEVGGIFVPTLDGLALGLCFTPLPEGFCLVPGFDECGDNDGFNTSSTPFGPPSYGVGGQDLEGGGEYELEVTIEEVPLTVEDSADLVLTKDCKPDTGALAGTDGFICTILVENPQGPGLPANVVVHDTLLTNVDPDDYNLEPPTFTFGGLGGFTDPCITEENPIEEIPGGKEFKCEIGTVPIGGKAIITMRITSEEGGDFNNHADVFSASTDADLTNNFDSDSVHVTAVADLSITKSDGEDPLDSGTSLTYTLDVRNNGPSTATNVLVEDFLPTGVSITSVNGTGGLGLPSCLFGVPGDVSRPTTCAFDTLEAAPGSHSTATMTIVVSVLPGDHNVLHNDARVSSDTLDLDNSNNFDSEDTAIRVSDLVITKTTDQDAYKPSAQVVYTLTVENKGPADADDVVVTDNLPINKTDRVFWAPFLDCTKPPGGTLLTCSLGTIPAGGSRTIVVAIIFKGSRGIISNTANVTSSTFDHALANNTSTKTVIVGSLPKP